MEGSRSLLVVAERKQGEGTEFMDDKIVETPSESAANS